MAKKKIQKHVYLEQDNVDVLDDLIENNVGVNTYSEAVRYIIDVYSKKNVEEDSMTNLRKINYISKNVDILIELVAGGLDQQEVRAIGESEDTYVYQDAKKIVEAKIQKSTTIKSNSRKTITMSAAENAKKESPNSYSPNFR